MAEDRTINYIELPGDDLDALEAFYANTLGWTFTDYGPEYRSFSDGRRFHFRDPHGNELAVWSDDPAKT